MNLSAKLFVLAILPTAILTLSIAPIEGENELAIANQTKGDLVGFGQNNSHPEEKGFFFEGDMILTPGQMKRSGINGNNWRWPNRVVYYAWAGIFARDYGKRNVVVQAMNQIQQKTCIRFRPVPAGQSAYVSITNANSGCNSNVGRTGRKQELNLQDPGCVNVGTAIHELVHAIGFFHEQSRPDRDQYVRIYLQNVESRWHYAFNKYPETLTFGVGYDYASVMHYTSLAFSVNNRPTIQARNGATLGGRTLTAKDALKINRMYGC